MPDDPAQTTPDSPRAGGYRRVAQSSWPAILALLLLAALLVGTVVMFYASRTRDEPWRIDYPGVTWVMGEDAATPEGKRYLQAEVRFEQDVVSAYDLQDFLAELVDHSKDTYAYYHIKVVNNKGVHVLDGVADRSGKYSITPSDHYEGQ